MKRRRTQSNTTRNSIKSCSCGAGASILCGVGRSSFHFQVIIVSVMHRRGSKACCGLENASALRTPPFPFPCVTPCGTGERGKEGARGSIKGQEVVRASATASQPSSLFSIITRPRTPNATLSLYPSPLLLFDVATQVEFRVVLLREMRRARSQILPAHNATLLLPRSS